MAARYIDKQATVSTSTAKNLPDAAGVQYDTDDGFIKYNDAGTIRTVVNTDEAQTLTNKTLTSPTINGQLGTAPTEVVTGANVIAASESGTTYFLNAAAGFASTLPAPAAGLKFRFVIGATPVTSTGHTIVTNGGSNLIQGQVNSVPVDDAGLRADDEDTITFVANQALEGDWVELVSDGTNWYVSGQINVVEALTFTAT